MANTYVVIDRDSTINEGNKSYTGRGPFVLDSSDFIFRPGTLDALARLYEYGCTCFVLTSQACVTQGLISERRLLDIHNYMIATVEEFGGHIEYVETVYPADDSDTNVLGKTTAKLGGLISIRQLYSITDEDTMWHIGDSPWEILAGIEFGAMYDVPTTTIQIEVSNWQGNCGADYKVGSLLEAAEIILGTLPAS
jgi:D-glycero-D-manno-heptose 1,7-bisphosphate phosphatase